MMPNRSDELFSGKKLNSDQVKQMLLQAKSLAIIAIGCSILGPFLWLTPFSICFALWSWVVMETVKGNMVHQMTFTLSMTDIFQINRLVRVCVFVSVFGAIYHIWLLQQTWYMGGLIGSLLR